MAIVAWKHGRVDAVSRNVLNGNRQPCWLRFRFSLGWLSVKRRTKSRVRRRPQWCGTGQPALTRRPTPTQPPHAGWLFYCPFASRLPDQPFKHPPYPKGRMKTADQCAPIQHRQKGRLDADRPNPKRRPGCSSDPRQPELINRRYFDTMNEATGNPVVREWLDRVSTSLSL